MSRSPRYVKVSKFIKNINFEEKSVELVWNIINSEVLDEVVKNMGPGYFAKVKETNTFYVLQTKMS